VTLQDATQAVADRLGYPVVVYDAHLEVAAFSTHDVGADRGRVRVILAGRATRLVEDRIAASGVDGVRAPVLLPGVDELEPRVLMSLFWRGSVRGYLSFAAVGVDERELERFAEVLGRDSERLGSLLAERQRESLTSTLDDQRFIVELLDSSGDADDTARRGVGAGLLVASDGYTVFLVHGASAGPAPAGVVDDIISDAGADAVRAVLNDRMVVIATDAFAPTLAARLRDERAQLGVVSGAGDRLPLIEAAESYRQARIALQAVARLPEVFGPHAAWSELGVDRVLLQTPSNPELLADLPPSIHLILHTEVAFDLPRTIECYLRHGADSQQTARELGVHKSTLYYRLERARRLTDLDLSSSATRWELLIGLHLARLGGAW
jgi:hypothetical protein